jgi:hypothetical protein
MKTRVAFLVLLTLLMNQVYCQNATPAQAKEILGEHFIPLDEAVNVLVDLPADLKIPFSVKTLEQNLDSWLVPIWVNGESRYYLIKANFENEVAGKKSLLGKDTLSLAETKKAIMLLYKLRPSFPERIDGEKPYKYFFRTKTNAPSKPKLDYHKTVAYADEKFLIINWPNSIELGVVNKDYISFLMRNEKGVEIKLGFEFLPEKHPDIAYLESIYVLTMFYQKK